MSYLYLAIASENTVCLINADPEKIYKLKESGWRVYRLGVADLGVMPGRLAIGIDLCAKFLDNLSGIEV